MKNQNPRTNGDLEACHIRIVTYSFCDFLGTLVTEMFASPLRSLESYQASTSFKPADIYPRGIKHVWDSTACVTTFPSLCITTAFMGQSLSPGTQRFKWVEATLLCWLWLSLERCAYGACLQPIFKSFFLTMKHEKQNHSYQPGYQPHP